MWNRIIECVPNISEGRDPKVVEAIAHVAIRHECCLIDLSMDADHHRSVLTFVGTPEALAEGIVALTGEAVEHIDLRKHRGTHPRMGAVDVIPFVPVHGVSMADCIATAHQVGERIADTYDIPVYLYAEAATSNQRRDLATIRKGEFEGFAQKIVDPKWRPDFGKPKLHPTAGVVAVGAREFLVAYNINLATSDLSIAKEIAAAVRYSSGGFRYVKALGLPLSERGIVQVSMNLTHFKKTPILRVFDFVKREAERRGVMLLGSEIVGTVPRQALYGTAARALQLQSFSSAMVLEDRIEEVLREDQFR
jgi:glutamate formiminotransferase